MSSLHDIKTHSGEVISPECAEGEEGLSPSPRSLEIYIALSALALSALALYLSRSIHLKMGGGGVDPKWWPTVLSGFALLLSALLTGKAFFAAKMPLRDSAPSHHRGWWRLGATLVLTFLHITIWKYAGFIWPTPFYLFALLWLYGIRGWKPLVLHPLLTTALIWVLFHYLLRVPL